VTLRLDYNAAAPEGFRALTALYPYLAKTTLDPKLVDLLFLRVSQINGCAYCVDRHSRDLLDKGETERRINALVVWHETPFFDARERAALAWADSLTRVAETRVPDADFAPLKAHFSDKEIADLSYAIALMNGLNRIAIGFRKGPEA
jgi:AhpD family alkylhydroperoxidase